MSSVTDPLDIDFNPDTSPIAGAVYRYKGSYERFLEAKAARMVAEDAQAQADRNKLKKEAEWVGRQPQARQSKSKARIDAYQVSPLRTLV